MKFPIAILTLTLFASSAFAQDQTVTEPKIIKIPNATMPREATESGLGGKVRVQVALDGAGNVTDVESVSGPDSVCSSVARADVVALREAARTAAMDAKFEPGAPARTWLTFDFPRKQLEEVTYSAAPVVDNVERTRSSAEPQTSRDSNVFTIKGSPNSTAEAAPPPDYKGPVNTGGTGAGRHVAGGDYGQSGPPSRSTNALPKTISGGVLNGKATNLVKPQYPAAARAVRASGAVSVQVLIDVEGKVWSATAVSGHPLLRAASVFAACQAEFSPTLLMGQPVKINGVITYNFIP
ncbi:MAG TPA: energy transducer TonB [Pyrinomonadaceae bacterium]|jgi:outer membrane biosynthesis protein TonB|nr:energy transducer TonB [Pyrinomonadaceae bacterium]